MKRVLITGGTGLVGSNLTKLLLANGYEVRYLSRKTQKGEIKTFKWNIDQQFIQPEAFEGVETIIHLAGADVAEKRWTARRKQLIEDSRVKSAQLLFDKAKEYNVDLKCFVSASGINYYGTSTSEVINEEINSPGTDFLAKCVVQWEKTVRQFEEICPTAMLRIGLVLAKEGGAFPKLSKPIKLFIGSPLGSGKQYVPWVHIDDLCNAFLFAIENKLQGSFNTIGDEHITNRGLTKVIAKKFNRPLIFPAIPSVFMKLIFGEMAGILLEGTRASNQKIKQTGFSFNHPILERAINDL